MAKFNQEKKVTDISLWKLGINIVLTQILGPILYSTYTIILPTVHRFVTIPRIMNKTLTNTTVSEHYYVYKSNIIMCSENYKVS